MKTHKLAIINILTFLVFSNTAFFYMYPIYLSSLDVSKTAIGLIMGIYSVASSVVRPFAGKSIDRVGEKLVLMSGLFLILVCSLLYHFVPGITSATFVLRILHGIGFSAFIAAAFSTIAKFTPSEIRGRAFSYNSAAILAALGSVPLAGEHLMDAFGHPAIFHGGAAATFLAFSLLLFTKKWKKR